MIHIHTLFAEKEGVLFQTEHAKGLGSTQNTRKLYDMHGAPKTQTHDLLILKIITWVLGSDPQKSIPLQRFSVVFFGRKWSEVGIEPKNLSKSRIEHRTFGFSASCATN